MESSEVAPMTLVTVTEYMCCKYHGYVPVLSSFMTYHQVCNKNNTMGATSAEWTANPSGFTPDLKSYVYCFVLFFPSIFFPTLILHFIHWTSSFLVAILVGSRDHRTQIWKGAIQGSFHQRLVAIGPVVSEEKIFMWIYHRVLC
jgi:hypothetical protein